MQETQNGKCAPNAFAHQSLRGRSQQLEKNLVEQKPVLGPICQNGNACVIYARYNTGKTLITLALLSYAINRRRLDASKIVYVNADDNLPGILEKTRVCEDHGFDMVVPGYLDFSMSGLTSQLREAIENNAVNGMILVIDTLKRAVDVMDKKRSREFTEVVRHFTAKGGTVIALAHTNKNLNAQGDPVPEGTGDILNDFDEGYLLSEGGTDKESGHRVVVFKRVKSRGGTSPESVHFAYDHNGNLTYLERLLSVRELTDEEVRNGVEEPRPLHEDEISISIELAIANGTETKMAIIQLVAEASRSSRRQVQAVLERYTGPDPLTHRWDFRRGARGRMVYFVHGDKESAQSAPATDAQDTRIAGFRKPPTRGTATD